MPHAIRIHANGGPEVLRWEEVAVGDPGPGEARVRHTAVGVNYIDTYHRSGLYKLPLPSGLGAEAAGIVEAVGSGVEWVKPGDRVAYCGGPLGAYSEARVMPGRSPGEAARRHFGARRGDVDAEGAHGPVSVSADLQAQGGRHDPVPRGRGRRRPDRVPVGARARRHDDRHRRFRREGGAREGERLHAHDRLHAREFRRAREGAHRRQGRAGRLRRHRQGHVSGVARLPVAARPLGAASATPRARSPRSTSCC